MKGSVDVRKYALLTVAFVVGIVVAECLFKLGMKRRALLANKPEYLRAAEESMGEAIALVEAKGGSQQNKSPPGQALQPPAQTSQAPLKLRGAGGAAEARQGTEGGKEQGEVAKTTATTSPQPRKTTPPPGYEALGVATDLKATPPEELEKFKIGDRVKMRDFSWEDWGMGAVKKQRPYLLISSDTYKTPLRYQQVAKDDTPFPEYWAGQAYQYVLKDRQKVYDRVLKLPPNKRRAEFEKVKAEEDARRAKERR
eukprot:TRINITY_DN21648_c0_g1_i1.p1 TRINITY_DN21648_c0_g1~~TRINITY_DN21648_c0_g1_i1.p1  ORF type:complete len:254 (+),score=83.55 TRINITY_DN21648_c0_g1_i1:170-931(+)